MSDELQTPVGEGEKQVVTPQVSDEPTDIETPDETIPEAPVEEITSQSELQKTFKGKFLGVQKIFNVLAPEDGLYTVVFDDKSTFLLPKCLLDSMVSDKAAETKGMPLPASSLKMMTIADEIEILLRTHYRLNVGEVTRFCTYLGNVVNNNYKLASRLLWGGLNEYKLPMSAVQDVLEANADKINELQKDLNMDALAAREAKMREQQ